MKRKEKPKVHLSFPKDGKVQPKGFEDVSVNDPVTVVLKGTVKSAEDNAEEWNPGKSMTVHITSCEIMGREKGPVSVDEAIKAAGRKV
ncbi:MAG: hypothetical protein KKB20_11490 [Proteobacteria bacterium]|nr:hypothetical protein [Pseudomonadota bacterium]